MAEQPAVEMMIGMQRFVDDDHGYLDWLDHHPDGFVINTGRVPSGTYLMLHRASCGTITGKPARGITFTGPYIKVYAANETSWRNLPVTWAVTRSPAGCASPRAVSPQPARSTGGKYDPCASTFPALLARVSR